MKKPRKRRKADPEIVFTFGNGKKKPTGLRRAWLNVFTHVNNRKTHISYRDVLSVGYPMVEISHLVPWSGLHDLCKEHFINKKGHSTYIWFGNRFFFTTKEDADLFKGLLYLL